ncbi:MAG: HAMP domain-containing histidine kinase [Bradyrhizobium sp.]|jgi:signal transduction histidine kinase|uniref:sensor histidine kinase n=1 Tax=Bradyrhizobium sp. TaxID=376 RepID=UPI0012289BFA|nr:HAMP domain-containing sensor histidine kinase [Bradyrhizobium sp.]THD46517.1 MAG: HAMP domain-containing histidine kinase [Bradyrhizobium sp.]
MKSITRTLALSLGMAAAAIFAVMLGIVIWAPLIGEGDLTRCQVAATILDRATVVDPGRTLSVRSTSSIEELKSNSPNLWYVVSSGNVFNEFGGDRRPPLPFSLPYPGLIGFSILKTLDQTSTFCLAAIPRGPSRLVMMIGGAQPELGQVGTTFVVRNSFPIAIAALAFASTVAIGAFLSARFVSRSIGRVTKLAVAINPAAPHGSISLNDVPVELKPLVQALNRAFDEIDAYIQMQRRFLGNAAHQLRTPLTLLRAKIEDVTEPALKVELIGDVRRLTSLVSAMLDLARLQNHTIEKRPIDLAAVTLDVLADFSPSALDAGIELSLEQVEERPTVVRGVEAAVRSALANLVGNALMHARGARRITAVLGRGSVSIRDDGAGLSFGSEGKLIEPFQTSSPAGDSAGLGLSIVQEIMAAHGGKLIIASIPGHGTTASLCFSEEAASAQN